MIIDFYTAVISSMFLLQCFVVVFMIIWKYEERRSRAWQGSGFT
jgi:hypothetical protein